MENTGFPKHKPWSNGAIALYRSDLQTGVLILLEECELSYRYSGKGCVRKSVYVLTPSTVFPNIDLHFHFNSMHIPLFWDMHAIGAGPSPILNQSVLHFSRVKNSPRHPAEGECSIMINTALKKSQGGFLSWTSFS